jgi:hypothetical protein
MNTPINLYDIKPNARFPVGSKVTFVDSEWLKVRGTVLGHAAEDRLWVQMPNEVIQADVEDVVGLDEVTERVEMRPSGYVESSRRPRNATILDFEDIDRFNEDEEDGDLEFIPDEVDFQDGDPVTTDDHPTNKVHTGELPSEQDPRDKVEEDDDCDRGCETLEVISIVPEVGDMTDLIEDAITASRLGVKGISQYTGKEVSKDPYTGGVSKGPYTGGRESRNPVLNALLQMKDKNGDWLYRNEADAALNYNVFDDKNIQRMLFTYGLNNDEIKNFADIRQRQLDTAKQKAYHGQPERHYGNEKFQKTPEYSWGQGAGVNYNVRPRMTQDQQNVYNRMSPEKKKELSSMPAAQQQTFWSRMQSKYPQYFKTATNPKQQNPNVYEYEGGKWPENYPPGGSQKWHGGGHFAASRSLRVMDHHADLVDGLLAMPRTANVLRQTVDLVSAVHELDDGKSLDDTMRSALRNTSRNLLTVTDHLKGVNNRIANRVAGEIEQLYVDALSN